MVHGLLDVSEIQMWMYLNSLDSILIAVPNQTPDRKHLLRAQKMSKLGIGLQWAFYDGGLGPAVQHEGFKAGLMWWGACFGIITPWPISFLVCRNMQFLNKWKNRGILAAN